MMQRRKEVLGSTADPTSILLKKTGLLDNHLGENIFNKHFLLIS
jgi:hypothetical protein